MHEIGSLLFCNTLCIQVNTAHGCALLASLLEYIPYNTVLHSCSCLYPIFFTKMSMDHRFNQTANSLNV